MKMRSLVTLLIGFAFAGSLFVDEAMAQRGRGGGGGRSGGGRSAGHKSGGAARQPNRGPSMSHSGGGNMQRGGARGGGVGMQRTGGGPGGGQRPGGPGAGGMQRPGGGPGGGQRPGGAPGVGQRPGAGGAGASGLQRPGGAPGVGQRPGAGGAGASGLQRPGGAPGVGQRPGVGGAGASGLQRPGGAPGGLQQPGGTGPAGAGDRNRPGASSDQLSDFLGMPGQGAGRPGAPGSGLAPGGRPGIDNRPNLPENAGIANRPGGLDRPGIDNRPNLPDRPGIDNRPNLPDRPGFADRPAIADRPGLENREIGDRAVNNINVGDVNVGNRANYADNRQAWVSQRENWGNDVRNGVGDRYNNVFNDEWYRRPYGGAGYNYWGGWAARGPYYAWTPAVWGGVGAFLGGAMASAQPVYYGYGEGGNVYYEDNSVYVNGQAAGTPEQYYQETQAVAAAAPAPDAVNTQEEWLPLGVYAVTSEDAPDSSAAMQLAVNKQGVLAGTFYNEDSGASRPLQGTVDPKSQRAVLTFGDGQNSETVLETGVYNLTQDEAPALLHFGADQSQPLLLVRLKPPAQ